MARYFIEEPVVTGLDGGPAVQVVFGPDDEALFGRCPVAVGFGLRMHVSSKSNSDSCTIAGRYSCADSHSHRRADAHTYTDAYPDSDTDTDSYSYSYSYPYSYPYSCSYTNSYSNSYTYTNSYAG